MARLSLGAVGVVTELSLSVRAAYKLAERMWLDPLDDVLARIDALSRATRHFEFFWMPGSARAACKALAETDAEPVYPLAQEGARCAWSYEVLANDRPIRHTEMEYSLPIARGAACFDALRARIARDFPACAGRSSTARSRPTISGSRRRAGARPPRSRSTRGSTNPTSRCSAPARRSSPRTTGGRTGARSTTAAAPSSRRSTRAGATGGARAIASIRAGVFLGPYLESLRPLR